MHSTKITFFQLFFYKGARLNRAIVQIKKKNYTFDYFYFAIFHRKRLTT